MHVLHWPGAEIVHVDILHVPPTRRRPCHTLLTSGMSERPMCPPAEVQDCRYAELFLSLPASWPVGPGLRSPQHAWPVRELTELARLPHINENWIWYGHTVGYPEPEDRIIPGVRFSGWILGPHLSLGHDTSVFRCRGRTIRYHSAIPIYPEELELARSQGPEALFAKMAMERISDVVNVRRRNLCPSRRRAP
jgi:hypothetical protein